MAYTVLAIFLVVFGLNMLLGLGIPPWVNGALALAAGVLLLMERFHIRVSRK